MSKSDSYKQDKQQTASFRDWRLSFFWFLAAADAELLQGCPPPEQYKQAGIGAAVLLTALAAYLSGFFAFVLILDNSILALLVALFWSLIIFNLDRFMVGSLRKNVNNRKSREIWVAMPRIVLATLIAALISKPIEVKIFNKQIESVKVDLIQSKVDSTLQPKIKALNMEIERLEASKRNLSTLEHSATCQNAPGYTDAWNLYEANQLRYDALSAQLAENTRQQQIVRSNEQFYYLEDDGNGGAKKVLNNAGTEEIQRLRSHAEALTNQMTSLNCSQLRRVAEEICSTYQQRLERRIDAESDNSEQLNEQVKKLRLQKEALEAQKNEKATIAAQDILGQLSALESLKKDDITMCIASWLIMLLFFILETAPIFVKILADRGSYDHLLNLKEKKIIFKSETELREIECDAERHLRIVEDKDGKLDETEREMNMDVMARIRDAQTDIAQQIIEAWREQEAERLRADPEGYLKNVIPKS